MIKLSKEQYTFARSIGVTRALYDSGYTPEAIKLAYTSQGIPGDYADELVKEAIWGGIARGLGMAAKGLAGFGSKAGKGLMAAGANQSGVLGRGLTSAGKVTRGATAGLTKGLRGLQRNPVQTTIGGAQNFGKGLLFGGGKGVGGALGKGAFGLSTASMLLGGNKPQLPQGPYGGMQYS